MDCKKIVGTLCLLPIVFAIPTGTSGQQLDQPLVEDSDEEYRTSHVINPDRVRLTSVINDTALKRFMNGEPIVIPLPDGIEQVVGAIRLEKPEYFKSEPFFARLRTRVVEDSIEIFMPVDAFDRLDYQPIEIPVYQSLKTTYKLVPDASASSKQNFKPSDVDTNFYVRLKPKNGVSVTFSLDKTFWLSNEIIAADLSFDDIEGIFFDEDKEGIASVVMRNGDNLTGQHNWPAQVTFVTPWGDEIVSLDEVVSVTRDRSARLVPSGVVSPKWIVDTDGPGLP